MASPVAQATSGRPGATPGAAVDQVAVKLTSTAKDGGGKISIRLNPEELGKVDVKLEIGRDGAVRATVSADRPETLDLMQRDARALEKALQDAGLKTDSNSLQFEKHDGQNAAGGQHADNDTGGAGASDEADGSDDLQDTDIDTASGDGIADDGSLNLVA
jgi:flagellar hook-length control protein FliK